MTRGRRVAVFPSDHYVGNPRSFLAHVERATSVVDEYPERIALLGIRPDWADPGLGYIEPGALPPVRRGGKAFHVSMFREKPGDQAATQIVRRGGLWNSFVMVFRVSRMLELIASARPADSSVTAGRVRRRRALYGRMARTRETDSTMLEPTPRTPRGQRGPTR